MAATYFDTHRVFQILNKKGFSKEQPEAMVEALQEVNLEHLATKADLAEVKFDILKWLIPLQLGMYAYLILKLGI